MSCNLKRIKQNLKKTQNEWDRIFEERDLDKIIYLEEKKRLEMVDLILDEMAKKYN